MYLFIYIQIHMLEARIKQLEKQTREEFRYSKTLLARLVPFLRKEVAEKEAVKKEVAEKAAEKEAAKNPVARVIFIISYFYF
jgi:hypothetical protein